MLKKITTTLYGHPVWHADTMDDFDKFISEQPKSPKAVFRGQDSDWPLLPYISRVASNKSIPSIEEQLHKAFIEESRPYVGNPPNNEWDWLALAQHHGLCTRMLDWSRDPYIALWFAVKSPPHDSEFKPEVWVFDTKPDKLVNNKAISNPFGIDSTKVFIPEAFHPRVEIQRAAFVVFKYMPEYPKGFCELSKNKLLRRRLQRVRFPHYKAMKIRRELNRMGYTRFNLFPDLDRACKKMVKELKKKPNKPIESTVNPLRGSTATHW